ncbi:hypothetical protein [Pseudoalteromonas sp. L1]|uniref:hypothetical protein n=1 Tax=Pseudoalteromonas sp. L1 TaxID=195716 RepID=UPI001F315974|nr:hypothetical protein [Pseudoalteromonas sp. L1]|tara:strand:- start:2659 stop:3177 length:519 start_codon:yes stop_codon:yes gene_type:complete
MYIDSITGKLIGTFIEWGVLMAFLFNLSSSVNKRDKSLLKLSIIMVVSYFCTDFIQLSRQTYFNWFLYDLITITVIVSWLYIKKVQYFTAVYYVIIGLFINACLVLSLHIDIYILNNREPWALWSLFSVGVNFLDILMIIAMIVNRDIFLFRKALEQIAHLLTLNTRKVKTS